MFAGNLLLQKKKFLKFKYNFQSSDKAFSFVANIAYNSILEPGTISCNCPSANVIYFIICNHFYLQHVRETVQKLSGQVKWHKFGCSYSLKYGHYYGLSDHLDRDMCKSASSKVQISEKYEWRWCTNKAKPRILLDPLIRKKNAIDEIKTLKTTCLYSLNDQVADD